MTTLDVNVLVTSQPVTVDALVIERVTNVITSVLPTGPRGPAGGTGLNIPGGTTGQVATKQDDIDGGEVAFQTPEVTAADVAALGSDLADETASRTSADGDLDAAISLVAGDLTTEEVARAAADALLIPLSQKGTAFGVAELDSNLKVPSANLPSYVDDILEYDSLAEFPVTGESGKLYLAIDTNLVYRWAGSTYGVTSSALALGETSSTAYRGDRGKAGYDHSQLTSGNPHNVTKSDVGLALADNTSDAGKPISTAQQTALDAKLEKANNLSDLTTPADARNNMSVPTQLALSRTIQATADLGLARLNRSWPNRATAPIKGCWIGDSEIDTVHIDRMFSIALAEAINLPNRPLTTWTAGGTILPGNAVSGVGGAQAQWFSNTGVTAAGMREPDRGISGDAVSLRNNDDIYTSALLVDKVTFKWLLPVSGSGATFDFYVDGVLEAAGVSASAAGSHSISGLSDATHVFRIVSHGVTLFDYAQLYYGNSASGYQPHRCAKNGSTSGDLVTWFVNDLTDHITAMDFDFIVLEHGTNDTSADTWFLNMSSAIQSIQAACLSSIVIALPNALAGDTTWDDFRHYARRLATTYNCFLVDVSEVFPDMSAGDPLNWYTGDGTHYSVAARATFGNTVFTNMFGGQTRDLTAVDGYGRRIASSSKWRSTGKGAVTSDYGHAHIRQTSTGNISLGFFLTKADMDAVSPVIEIGMANNQFTTPGIRYGAGGGAAFDTTFYRYSPGALALTSLGVGGGNAGGLRLGSAPLITGVKYATSAALPACTYANGPGGTGVGATLTANANGQLSIDGVAITAAAVTAASTVLVANQAAGEQNGIYGITQRGSASLPFILTRVSLLDEAVEFADGVIVFVGGTGATTAGRQYTMPPTTVVVGTTPTVWTLDTTISTLSLTTLGVSGVSTLGATTTTTLTSSGLITASEGISVATSKTIALPNGTFALPSLTFTSDPNTGMYRVGADSIGFSCNGTLKVTIDDTIGIIMGSNTQIRAADGAVGAPAFSFSSDSNTGLMWVGADQFGVVTGGANRITFGNAVMTFSDAVDIAFNATTGTKIGTGSTQKLGFYGATPVVRQGGYTQTFATADKTHAARTATALTDNTAGTANSTLEALTSGSVYATDVAAIRNNFADLAAMVNKVIVDLADTAGVVNAVVDDLQAYGLTT